MDVIDLQDNFHVTVKLKYFFNLKGINLNKVIF